MPNVPHYRQESNSSCLPACARMVLAFCGIHKSEYELRRLLKTRVFGTSILNMRNLETLGVETCMISGTMDLLRATIAKTQPAIVLLYSGALPHWAPDDNLDYLHAVVVIGFDKTNVQVHDPAFSTHPISIPQKAFLEAWSYARQTVILLEKSSLSRG